MRVPEYYWFDPSNPEDRAGFRPDDGVYRSIERGRQKAEQERGNAELEKLKAEQERRNAEQETQRADEEMARAERTEQELARLKALLDRSE